ncbi:cytochrome P450 [Stigmatella aurantiaca]|uniref:Cytochrome P450 n=1 Tax=Stigmatella aurantiaca (strain DW4/3-1) TaxID=378806 RepID=Q08PM8_STIAD|nr:cytochrome P450 [Stigmatella aurantiaca]ADO71372.1 Cytochrome P450 [Stigmatella aurantiaca DW4/3-1]EAU62440.1 RubU [Stigmatella aurantiaca DW4/3-1]
MSYAVANTAFYPRYDLLDPDFPKSPYPLLHRMRTEEPVFWFEPLNTWVVTRYEEVSSILKDPMRFSSRRADRMLQAQLPSDTPSGIRQTIAHVMSLAAMFSDPPVHTHLRSEANKGFSPRAMAPMAQRIQKVTDELISRMEGRGEMDGFLDFFEPFALTVIGDLMGVPREDQHLFIPWTQKTTKLLGGSKLTLEEAQASLRAFEEMNAYLAQALAERQRNPRDDMMSFLLAGYDPGRFPLEALAGMCSEIIGGANAPTGDTLGNALLACLSHPEELEKARHTPALWKTAVPELLRYDGPILFWSRLATEDVVLGGKRIRAGQMVYASLAGANRDPDVFPEPDQLDFSRPNAHKHVSFSFGPHHCIGAGLARMEMTIVFETLFRRLPGLRLAGPVQWREGSLTTRGPTRIPLVF